MKPETGEAQRAGGLLASKLGSCCGHAPTSQPKAAEARRCPCTWLLASPGRAGTCRPERLGARVLGSGELKPWPRAGYPRWYSYGTLPTIHVHPGPVHMAFFRNQLFADGIQLGRGHTGVGWPEPMTGVLTRSHTQRGCARWVQRLATCQGPPRTTPEAGRDAREDPTSDSTSGRGHRICDTSGLRDKEKQEDWWLRDPTARGCTAGLLATPSC